MLAAKALELGVLVLATRAMDTGRPVPSPVLAEQPVAPPDPDPVPDSAPAAAQQGDFLSEGADSDARLVIARDDLGEIAAAFLADGRLRLTDAENRRFAGMLQNDKADLLEISTGAWSTVYVRRAPDGKVQLEVHGGPYDTRVLTCEPSPQ